MAVSWRTVQFNAYLNIIQRSFKTGTEYETLRNETFIDGKYIHNSIVYYFNGG